MIFNQFDKHNVVLASKSPRRQQLIEGMNIPFTTVLKEVDESFPSTMPVDEIAGYLSKKKAMAFSLDELPENFLLITADTIVVVDNEVLNKPLDREEAIKMLSLLSGRDHKVITGVSIRNAYRMVTFSEESDVRFVPLTQEEICYYVDKYLPYDKAGSYGIQEWIGYIAIESVRGSFFNVMGLPTHRLYRELLGFARKDIKE
jgi:septum formation protein